MSWWDPKNNWGLPTPSAKIKINGGRSDGGVSNEVNTLRDAARQLLSGNHEVQGQALDRQGNPTQPDVLYTNPVLAFLNDARAKAVAARGFGLPSLIPGGPNALDRAAQSGGIRPNVIQHPSDAHPNPEAAAGMAAVDKGAQLARGLAALTGAAAAANGVRQSAPGQSLPGLDGILAGLKSASDAVGNIAQNGSFPQIPNGGDVVLNGGTSGTYDINLPDVPMPTAPKPVEFKRNDFSQQANKMVGEAYGPQYQALSEAVDSAKKQGTQQDQLLAGLYSQLVNADKAQGASVDARYDKDIQAAQANSKTRTADAAAGYNNTAQSQAEMLKSMGMGDAAAELLKQGVSDAGWAQQQAKTASDAQTDYLTGGQNNQADWYSGIQNADQTTGLAARQQNGRDTGNLLSQLDQQKLGIASSQSQDALQYGNDLSSQDLQIQQANYDVGQDAYSNALNAYKTQQDQQLQEAQLQLQAQGMSSDDAYKWASLQQQQNQAIYQQQVDARNDAYNRSRDSISDDQWNAQHQLDETKYTTDAAAQAAQINQDQQRINQSGQGSGVDPTGDQTVLAQIAQVAPQNAGQVYNFIQQLGNNPGFSQSLPTLIQAAQAQAAANGIDPSVATTAAVAYWTNILKGNMGSG